MAYNRISARRGSAVDLDIRVLRGGVLTDPFGIYRIEIYKGKVAADTNVAIIEVDSPDTSSYPSPLQIGTNPGEYLYQWAVPDDTPVPDVYFDVWYFWGVDPRAGSESGSSSSDLSLHESKLIQICNRFWIYPDQWYVDGGLQTIRFGFEPLDIKFHKSEVRPLEIGLMPLPLYDFDYNLVMPIIPYINATISVKTENEELIIDDAPMTIKLRQGAHRTNPFVLSYLLNTLDYFIGTYKYRIKLVLPDGTTRVSGNFYFTVS